MNQQSPLAAKQPTQLSDLFLLQGYVFTKQGYGLVDLAPYPDLPTFCGYHLMDKFDLTSAAHLHRQLNTTYQTAETTEQYLELTLTETNHTMHIFSCMTPIIADDLQSGLVLWRPIKRHHNTIDGLTNQYEFHQWLSLTLDHLWRTERPFSLAVIKHTEPHPTTNDPTRNRPPTLTEFVRIITTIMPTNAVLAKLNTQTLALLLPDTLELPCRALINILQQSVVDYANQQKAITVQLDIASHTYAQWPAQEPPTLQTIHYQLLAKLLVELDCR